MRGLRQPAPPAGGAAASGNDAGGTSGRGGRGRRRCKRQPWPGAAAPQQPARSCRRRQALLLERVRQRLQTRIRQRAGGQSGALSQREAAASKRSAGLRPAAVLGKLPHGLASGKGGRPRAAAGATNTAACIAACCAGWRGTLGAAHDGLSGSNGLPALWRATCSYRALPAGGECWALHIAESAVAIVLSVLWRAIRSCRALRAPSGER